MKGHTIQINDIFFGPEHRRIVGGFTGVNSGAADWWMVGGFARVNSGPADWCILGGFASVNSGPADG